MKQRFIHLEINFFFFRYILCEEMVNEKKKKSYSIIGKFKFYLFTLLVKIKRGLFILFLIFIKSKKKKKILNKINSRS